MGHNTSDSMLLDHAARGWESAWRDIVRGYTPLVRAVCLRSGIRGMDADDVAATVWLRLVLNLRSIREPAALPGWLATTARRECFRVMRSRDRHTPTADEPTDQAEPAADVPLLDAERHEALREALVLLPRRDRELLSLLFSDPPTPYDTIVENLGIPRGSIGPTRRRCLARIRRIPSIAALLDD